MPSANCILAREAARLDLLAFSLLHSSAGSRLGMLPGVMAMLMLRLGLKLDLDQGNFRCLVVVPFAKCKESLLLAASFADEFPEVAVV